MIFCKLSIHSQEKKKQIVLEKIEKIVEVFVGI